MDFTPPPDIMQGTNIKPVLQVVLSSAPSLPFVITLTPYSNLNCYAADESAFCIGIHFGAGAEIIIGSSQIH